MSNFALVHDSPGMLYDAAFGNGLFVAVGDGIAMSANDPRRHWNLEHREGFWRGVCHGADIFLACGLGGHAMWRTDQPGGNWNEIGGMPVADWNKAAYGNGLHMVVADGKIAISANGKTGWALKTVPVGFGADVAFDNGIFILVGKSGAMTTANGTTADVNAAKAEAIEAAALIWGGTL